MFRYTEAMEQRVLPGKLADLAGMYRVRDEKIERFLLARPELVKILNEGAPHIERIFGKDMVVELEQPVYWEPGGDEDVYVRILTILDPDAACDRRDKLWDDWFSEASADPNSLPLIIGLDYAGDDPIYK